MRPDEKAPVRDLAPAAVKSWTPPKFRKLATSEAELNISGTNPDSEGFIS